MSDPRMPNMSRIVKVVFIERPENVVRLSLYKSRTWYKWRRVTEMVIVGWS